MTDYWLDPRYLRIRKKVPSPNMSWLEAKAVLTLKEYIELREIMRPYWEAKMREFPHLHDVMDENFEMAN